MNLQRKLGIPPCFLSRTPLPIQLSITAKTTNYTHQQDGDLQSQAPSY